MKLYDVIILGAGPAGLIAARKLRKAGVSYLLIDRKSQIGTPLRSGEAVPTMEFFSIFKSVAHDFVKNRVRKHRVVFNDYVREFASDTLELDMRKFEAWLSKDLNIMMDCRCDNVEIVHDHVKVHTSRGIMGAKMAILSCGADYRIQKGLGLVKREPLREICYGGIYKNYRMKKDTFYYIFDSDSPGYFWVFPKSQTTANMGFGLIASFSNSNGSNVIASFNRIRNKYNIGGELVEEFGGVIPASGPIRKTYYDRLLVSGDAAGMVYAGTGEGICYALHSGLIAADVAIRALKEDNFSSSYLKQYEKLWWAKFGAKLKAGILARDLMLLSYKYRFVRQLLASPTESELNGMMLKGILPKRARIAHFISALFRLDRRKGERLPAIPRIAFKHLKRLA